jgi:hypothetical protein
MKRVLVEVGKNIKNVAYNSAFLLVFHFYKSKKSYSQLSFLDNENSF